MKQLRCLRFEKAMALEPELEQYFNGSKMDLGDPDALLLYNKVVLRYLTGLSLTLPPKYLIPSVCLRYHFLREILVPNAHVFEVGTGTSAILALIAAKLYGASVVATEVNEISFEYAKKNAQLNGLENQVQVIPSKGEIIPPEIAERDLRFTVAFTNPPQYATETLPRFVAKKRGFMGVKDELDGGLTGIEFSEEFIESVLPYLDSEKGRVALLIYRKEFVNPLRLRLKIHFQSIRITTFLAGTRKRWVLLGLRPKNRN